MLIVQSSSASAVQPSSKPSAQQTKNSSSATIPNSKSAVWKRAIAEHRNSTLMSIG